MTHEERLTVPWRWWFGAFAIVAVLTAPFGMGRLGLAGWAAAFAVLAPATGVALWRLGGLRVAVADGELRVDDARLPVRFVADAIPLDPAGRRELLGPGADPLAFVVQRPWVRGATQIVLDDPADPTPYWLVSTSHPDRLAAALQRSRGSAPGVAPRQVDP